MAISCTKVESEKNQIFAEITFCHSWVIFSMLAFDWTWNFKTGSSSFSWTYWSVSGSDSNKVMPSPLFQVLYQFITNLTLLRQESEKWSFRSKNGVKWTFLCLTKSLTSEKSNPSMLWSFSSTKRSPFFIPALSASYGLK